MDEFVQAIGVLAESSYLFMKAAIVAGANQEEALLLTAAYIKAMINNGKKGESK